MIRILRSREVCIVPGPIHGLGIDRKCQTWCRDRCRLSGVVGTLSFMNLKALCMYLRHRHLMLDLAQLLPHAKKDFKLDTKSDRGVINEVSPCRGHV